MTRAILALLIGFTLMWAFIATGGFDHPLMVKLYPERCLPGQCSYDVRPPICSEAEIKNGDWCAQ